MTNATVSRSNLDVDSPLFVALKQVVGWGWARFMSAPLQNTGLAMISAAMVVSASNALYWQTARHPAPFFVMPTQTLSLQDTGKIIPLLHAPRPLEFTARRSEAVQIIPAQQPELPLSTNNSAEETKDSVSNAALAKAQQVLSDMGLFSGKVDGFHGPLTAGAIRAYELRQGLSPKGALTSDVISRILGEDQAIPQVRQTPAPALVALNSSETTMPANSTTRISNSPEVKVEQPIPDAISVIANSAVSRRQEINDEPTNPAIDKALIERIQRGLFSLGFYSRSIDGIAGESTAKAIREFENFKSFNLTGRISGELLTWLEDAGAEI